MKYSDSEFERETKSAGEVHSFYNASVFNPDLERFRNLEKALCIND